MKEKTPTIMATVLTIIFGIWIGLMLDKSQAHSLPDTTHHWLEDDYPIVVEINGYKHELYLDKPFIMDIGSYPPMRLTLTPSRVNYSAQITGDN